MALTRRRRISPYNVLKYEVKGFIEDLNNFTINISFAFMVFNGKYMTSDKMMNNIKYC
jgi:hypothetical protein